MTIVLDIDGLYDKIDISKIIDKIDLEIGGSIIETIYDFNYEVLLRLTKKKIKINQDFDNNMTHVTIPIPFSIIQDRIFPASLLEWHEIRINIKFKKNNILKVTLNTTSVVFDQLDNTNNTGMHHIINPLTMSLDQSRENIIDVENNIVPTQNIIGNDFDLFLDLCHPTGMLYFFFIDDKNNIIHDNIIDSMKLLLQISIENYNRIDNSNSKYDINFDYDSELNKNKTFYCPDDMKGYYFIFFGKDLANTEGMVNMSHIDKVILKVKFNKDIKYIPEKCRVYSYSKNVLIFASGMAGLRFSR
jgi:hypothetical protein